MSVQKFSSPSEVPTPPRVIDVEERVRRANALWRRARLRAPLPVPRGVSRFTSLQEAQLERDQRTTRHLKALRGPDAP